MPFDCASLISSCVATGFGAATRTANVRLGETVVVIGCGGVGLQQTVAQAYRMLECINEAFEELVRGSVVRSATIFED